VRASARSVRLAHHIASVALSYPDQATVAALPGLRAAAADLPGRWAAPLGRVLDHLDRTALPAAAASYVDTFDLRRRCCLYLTYYTHGDTRRRGLALLRFRQAYQAVGLENEAGELPDHLAVVLEFSALGHPREAVELLVAHRSGLDLLWRALDRLDSPYAHAVAAVRLTLPAPGPDDEAAARRLAREGPPTEQVGLAPGPVPVELGGTRG
jgi:nitrate reductase molybdenum cofactor assembly chaperone NarJ/NarW